MNGEVCFGKKELAAEKVRVDFFDTTHDLNTPMLLSDNNKL